jgi:hypothetical protein
MRATDEYGSKRTCLWLERLSRGNLIAPNLAVMDLAHAPNPGLARFVSIIAGYLLPWCYRKSAFKSVSFYEVRTLRDPTEAVIRPT